MTGTAPIPTALRIGAHAFLPPCLLLREAGQGGMGTVYEAWHIHRNERCAVKVVRAGHSESRAYLEGSLGQRDLGPHVVRAIDFQRSGPLAYLVMEWVEGLDLQRLASTVRLTPGQVVEVARQACDGLAAIHAQEAIHRDIKPANLLVGVDGRVRISDLGIVRSDDALHTDTRVGVGTRLFMAPEQRRGELERVDHRSDLYSLGMTLYVLLGDFLVKGDMSALLRRLAEDAALTPLAELAPALDPALVRIVERCLADEPAQRPADARELRAALDALGWPAAEVAAPARRDVPPPPDRATLRAARRAAFEAVPPPSPAAHDARDADGGAVRRRAARPSARTVGLGLALVALVLPYVLGLGASPSGAPHDDEEQAEAQAEVLGEVQGEAPAQRDPERAEATIAPAAEADTGTASAEAADAPRSEREADAAPPGGPDGPAGPPEGPEQDAHAAQPLQRATAPGAGELAELPGFRRVPADPDDPWRYVPALSRELDCPASALTFVRVSPTLLVAVTETPRSLEAAVLDPTSSPLAAAQAGLPLARVDRARAERLVAALNELVPGAADYRFAIPTFEDRQALARAAAGAKGFSVAASRRRAEGAAGDAPEFILEAGGADEPLVRPTPVADGRPGPLGLVGVVGGMRELAIAADGGAVRYFGRTEPELLRSGASLDDSVERADTNFSDAWDGLRLVIHLSQP